METKNKELIMVGDDKEEIINEIYKDVFDLKDKNYHFLAFEQSLYGYRPVNVYLLDKPEIMQKEHQIMSSIINRQEVCNLYPKVNLTLYPFKPNEKSGFTIDLKNIDKHFVDILDINDNVLKTKYLFVSTGCPRADNFDLELIKKYLLDLLQKSKYLEIIYVE